MPPAARRAAIGPGEGSPNGPLLCATVASQDAAVPPVLPLAAISSRGGTIQMRSAISLAGGLAVSAAGVFVVVGSAQDVAGVLLIAAGVVVAILGLRTARPTRAA
jgi:hypothetical protein